MLGIISQKNKQKIIILSFNVYNIKDAISGLRLFLAIESPLEIKSSFRSQDI